MWVLLAGQKKVAGPVYVWPSTVNSPPGGELNTCVLTKVSSAQSAPAANRNTIQRHMSLDRSAFRSEILCGKSPICGVSAPMGHRPRKHTKEL